MKGAEAFTEISQTIEIKRVRCGRESGYTQIRAQIEQPVDSDLEKVISAWPELSAPIKAWLQFTRVRWLNSISYLQFFQVLPKPGY